MFKISREITSVLELNKVLESIINKTTAILNTEIGSVLLWDRSGKNLVIRASKGLSEKIINETNLRTGERVSGWVVQHRKSLLVDDIEKDKRFAMRSKEKYYTRSLISVPLKVKGKIIGVLNVNNKKTRERFTQDDLDLLEAIAAQASIAIGNAMLIYELHHVYMHTIRALAVAIDSKDHYTYHHSKNVAKYAVMIARQMDITNPEIQDIKHACQLHDLGKISIPDYILANPGPLSKKEWEKVKLHSLKGAEILSPLKFLDEVIELIMCHHERYNGSGYPKGLKGKRIPLGARIMLVADAFDAMTSDRPYRKRLSTKAAIAELKRNSGTQFDPDVVRAFLKVIGK